VLIPLKAGVLIIMKMDKRNKVIKIKCYNCSKLFSPFSGREKTSKYCSMKCMGRYRRGKPNGKPKDGKWIKCKICGEEFYEYKYLLGKRKYCSRKCNRLARKGIKQTDEYIKKRVVGRMGYRHSEETIQKISESNTGKIGLRGKDSPSWKGGKSPLNNLIRKSGKMNNWRKSVFKKDSYTCQITKEIGRRLHCHHVVSFKSILNEIKYAYSDGKITFERAMKYNFLWDTDNGITLYKKIHKDKHKLKE